METKLCVTKSALAMIIAALMMQQSVQADGIVRAESYIGDGSQLTNISASNSDRLDGMDSLDFAVTDHTHVVADSSKKFYLDRFGYNGATALTACAPGYHVASLWEFRDLGKLNYTTVPPFSVTTPVDIGPLTGQPPVNSSGWIRTGFPSSTSVVPGIGNCDLWTSNSAAGNGTTLWINDGYPPVAEAKIRECDLTTPVWCIED